MNRSNRVFVSHALSHYVNNSSCLSVMFYYQLGITRAFDFPLYWLLFSTCPPCRKRVTELAFQHQMSELTTWSWISSGHKPSKAHVKRGVMDASRQRRTPPPKGLNDTPLFPPLSLIGTHGRLRNRERCRQSKPPASSFSASMLNFRYSCVKAPRSLLPDQLVYTASF